MKRRGRERQLSVSSCNGSVVVTEERRGRERQTSMCVSKGAEDKSQEVDFGDREELDFQFDEELDRPLPAVKQNTFTEWSDSDSECEEVGDDFINKVS